MAIRGNRIVRSVVVSVFALVWTLSAGGAALAVERPESFTALAKKAGPAVVNIRTEKKTEPRPRRGVPESPFGNNDPFREFFERFYGEGNRAPNQRSLGSGFLIDPDGYIVTNNHVVEGADAIRVKLKSGDEYDATLVGRDPSTDLALIRIQSREPLPYFTFGDSEDLEVGEWVVAIGSPFGLEQTVTAGIVSAKGRVIESGPYDDFIQTDASINPGNSGGPLIDMAGRVVGINTAIVASGQGIGFAIPAKLAQGIISQLRESGKVVRGWLGVSIQPLDENLATYSGVPGGKGVYVADVVKGDPAEKAGIRAGDVIVEIDGKKIEKTQQLTLQIAGIRVGEIVPVVVYRNGKRKVFRVRIAKRADDAGEKGEFHPGTQEDAYGIRVEPLNREMAERLGGEAGRGVLVTSVEAGSKAEAAGVLRGDVVLEINHVPVDTPSAFASAIQGVENEPVLLYIRRMNRGFVVVKLEP